MSEASLRERHRAVPCTRPIEQARLAGAPSAEVHAERHAGIGQHRIGAGMFGALRCANAGVNAWMENPPTRCCS